MALREALARGGGCGGGAVFRNASALFRYAANDEENPLPRLIASTFLLAPVVSFGCALALNACSDSLKGDTGAAARAAYDGVFAAFAPPHALSMPDLDLSKLLLLDFPSMAWDLEQYIEATAAFFSLNAVASVLKTALTVAAMAQAVLSENPKLHRRAWPMGAMRCRV